MQLLLFLSTETSNPVVLSNPVTVSASVIPCSHKWSSTAQYSPHRDVPAEGNEWQDLSRSCRVVFMYKCKCKHYVTCHIALISLIHCTLQRLPHVIQMSSGNSWTPAQLLHTSRHKSSHKYSESKSRWNWSNYLHVLLWNCLCHQLVNVSTIFWHGDDEECFVVWSNTKREAFNCKPRSA